MSENETNFESLRRLLAIKRHEVPPPGYFNDFSGQVRVRIASGENLASSNLLEELFDQAPWLARMLRVFEMKPAFAGTFASALCLLLLFGIIYSERPESPSNPLLQTANTTASPSPAAVSATMLASTADQSGIISSTNPVLSLQPLSPSSPFEQSPFGAQFANFTLPGN